MATKNKTATNAAPAIAITTPDDRATFISNLGLPDTVTDEELQIILTANVGASLPFKPEVFPALVSFALESTHLSEEAARKFIAEKFPMIAPTAATPDEHPQAETRAELVARLELPSSTTDGELNVILAANEGTELPFKKSVYTHVLAHLMRSSGIPEHEARTYLTQKFPSLTPPDAHRKSASEAANFLRTRLVDLYNLADDASDEDIAKAAAAIKDDNIAAKARRAQQEADETAIGKKMSIGLTREQAISVIKRQREHDEQLAHARAARLPRLLEILKSHGQNLKAARKEAADVLGLHDGSEFNAAVEALKNSAQEA